MSPDQETPMNPAAGAPMIQSPAPAPVPEASPLPPAAPVQAPSLAEAPIAPLAAPSMPASPAPVAAPANPAVMATPPLPTADSFAVAPAPSAPALAPTEAPVAPSPTGKSSPSLAPLEAPGAPMMQSPAPAPVPEASPLPPAPSPSPTEPSAPLAVPTLDPSLLQEAIADVPSEATPATGDAPSPFSVTAPNADFSETAPGESVSPLEAAASTEEGAPAPASPFESGKKSTPSVAFNDPASQPDAPAPGTDPGKPKGLNLSTPEFL
ncbi:hypothetical protein IJH89_01570, partial [Candidatus Saccharibacteria bacterium]|nr:hypothetical protein [Candidatus Saccharibacteria bacterium]